MVIEPGIYLAMLSGVLGTLGSVFGKLAGFYEFSDWWGLAKVGLLLAMVTVNTIGYTFFVRALVSSGSSLPATVVSSTINYLFAAILGILMFGETPGLYWWCGTVLILLGLMVMCHSPRPAPESKEAKSQ